MTDYRPSLLGSVMKAVACTPNRNFDEASYQRGVIEPAQQIRRLQEELGDARPSDEQIRQVIAWLEGILDCKQVDRQERAERLSEIVALHELQALLPHLVGGQR